MHCIVGYMLQVWNSEFCRSRKKFASSDALCQSLPATRCRHIHFVTLECQQSNDKLENCGFNFQSELTMQTCSIWMQSNIMQYQQFSDGSAGEWIIRSQTKSCITTFWQMQRWIKVQHNRNLIWSKSCRMKLGQFYGSMRVVCSDCIVLNAHVACTIDSMHCK